MHLLVEHTTEYRYSSPNRRSIQYVRQTPLSNELQSVENWELDAPGSRHKWTDGFGNVVYTVVLNEEHDSLTISVRGAVTTYDANGILPFHEHQDPLFLTQDTWLTRPSETMQTLADTLIDPEPDNLISSLHNLVEDVREKVTYVPGETGVHTSAAQAFASGSGVCQDQAHIFLACVRHSGIPARYVSGYLCAREDAPSEEASHAWTEVLVPGLGWVGFDVANGVSPDEHYIRLAVGRDYKDAAPIRGVRHGGGDEEMEIHVKVGRAEQPEILENQ